MKLILNYLSLHLKISLEYKSSFIMTIISQTIAMFVELFTVYALFSKFKLFEVYNPYALLLGFSTLWLGYSTVELFGRGFDHFSNLIVKGDFDILLIRPANLFIQIMGTDICYEKVGRTTIALFMFIYSSIKIISHFTLFKILLLIFMVVGCIIIITSLFIIGASFCFITIQGLEVINIFTNGTRQVAQYPISIYKKAVRIFFATIIPIALVNYYPIDYLTGKTDNILYVFMPMITIIMLFISKSIFNIGLKKYCSTGS